MSGPGRPAPTGGLADLLLQHPQDPDEGLLHGVHGSVTLAAARGQALALGADLLERGLLPGQAVAVELPNGPEVVVAMTAVWHAGGVFVPLNPLAPRAETDSAIATSEAVLVVGRGAPFTVLAAPRRSQQRYPDGTALVLWTSGTTGRPQPIRYTHTAYLALLDRVLAPLRGSAARRSGTATPNLIPVSMALNSGIFNALFGLRAGASLVIMERFRVEEFAELVARFGIRSTVLPPAAIAMLNDSDLDGLAPLRYVRSITAPLSPVQARRFIERFGVFVLNSYGQAEIGEVIGWTADDAKCHPDRLGAVGRPHSGVSVRVVDEDGADVPAGEMGRLHVRAREMAGSDVAGPTMGDRLDPDGYLDTGDVARIDEVGFVWIEGRAGSLINRGGNKIFPEQVEEVLELHPSVTEAAVVGVPDDRLGEVPVALVVESRPTGDAELIAHCRDHLVAYKTPIRFHRVAELPRTGPGKLHRSRLAALVPG